MGHAFCHVTLIMPPSTQNQNEGGAGPVDLRGSLLLLYDSNSISYLIVAHCWLSLLVSAGITNYMGVS